MSQPIGRHVLLAMSAAAAAGGILAAAWGPGKPASASPPRPHPRLPGVEALRLADPPVRLPPAALFDAAGRAHGLAAFVGSGLVINLWATWCQPCVAELPALAALAGQVQGAGIMVLPLSSDRGGAAAVEECYRRHGITGLPVWLDPKGAAARAWGAHGIPTTLIVDRQGRECARLEGAADWAGDAALGAIWRLVG